MKKLFTLTFFLPLLVSAQRENSSLIRIGLTGGYTNHASNSVTAYLNSFATAVSDWNTGLSAGVALNEKWEVGVGAKYQMQDATSNVNLNLISEGVDLIAVETARVITSSWTGRIYATRYWQAFNYQQVFNHLYFTPTVGVSFGKAKTKAETANSIQLFAEKIEDITVIWSNSWRGENFIQHSRSFNVFAVYLSPGLTYFFSKHIAATLNLGGLQCNLVDWEWSNRQWVASLSPAYWQYGMIIAF